MRVGKLVRRGVCAKGEGRGCIGQASLTLTLLSQVLVVELSRLYELEIEYIETIGRIP